ncbi:MAG: sigma-70 family RNA polymerase sigma factor [Bacteroidota bacterium]
MKHVNTDLAQTKDRTQRLSRLWKAFEQSGTEASMRALYEFTYRIIFLSAYRLLKNKEEAEDVVQEVSIKMLSQREKSKPVIHFSAWLSRLTRNTALQVLECRKKQYLTKVGMLSMQEDQAILDVGKEKDHRFVLLFEGIPQLKGKNFQKILNLELEGYSNPEIAEILGKTEKHVRDRKYLAKKELKRILKQM